MEARAARAAVRAACILAVVMIASSPLLFSSAFASFAACIPKPVGALAWLAIPLTPWLCARRLSKATRGERVAIGSFVLVLGLYEAGIHHALVDKASMFQGMTNDDWQRDLHKAVLARDPVVIPHSYRFLPNALTELLAACVGDFGRAKVLYRIVFQTLVSFALYVWSSRYLSRRSALVPPLLYAAVYPMTNVGYAGQLTDPMSHFCFLLAFLFIESGEFQLLVWTIAVGVLAKESVAAMAFVYPFLAREDPKRWRRTALLIAIAVVILFAVRRWIAGGIDYYSVSGVGLEHIRENLVYTIALWLPRISLTVGVWLPFALWRWNEQPRNLRVLAIFLFIALVATNVAFSWLYETRNFVPLIFVLAVLATRRLALVFGDSGPDERMDAAPRTQPTG